MEISVVIPIYNAEKYIRRCLESVVNQQHISIEIICIDDASTDLSASIVKEFSSKFKNIVLYENACNMGAGYCRNFGLEKCSSSFVHFLDADDYVHNNAYYKPLKLMTDNNVDWVMCRCRVLNMRMRSKVKEGKKSKYELNMIKYSEFGKEFTYFDLFKFINSFSAVPWNCIYSKRFLNKNNIIFPELYCVNDRYFKAQVMLHTKRFVICNCFLVNHIVGITNTLICRRKEYFECNIRSVELVNNISCVGDMVLFERIMCNEILDLLYFFGKYCEDKKFFDKYYPKVKSLIKGVLDKIELDKPVKRLIEEVIKEGDSNKWYDMRYWRSKEDYERYVYTFYQ